MKRMQEFGTLLAVWLLVVACGTDCVEQWLTRAEGCMETAPDSAYKCLLHIEEAGGCTDEQSAHYALLRTQSMHKCKMPLEDDSLINVAVDYYTQSDDRHRLALSLLYKGLVHKRRGEVERAVESFVRSEEAFEGVDDNQYKALLFNHYASLLMNQNMFSESLVYYKKSYQNKLLGDSLHFVVSACGQIANLFEILEQIDSSKVYYERGLAYARELGEEKRVNYYWLLQNYAAFLTRRENYDEAERLLTACLDKQPDTDCLPTLYAALTSLYYEKGEYETALSYGKRVMGSSDSMTICGGYLRLYNIYKGMGQMDSAFYYHNQYRQYNSDITMRKQSTKVAVIPHQIKNVQLAAENRTLTGWRLWSMVAIFGMMVVAWGIHRKVKNRHCQEQHAQSEKLDAVGKRLGETSAELGRLKGAMTNRLDSINRMREEHQKMLDKHKDEIDRLKQDVCKLETDIKGLKENNRATKQAEGELKRDMKRLERELKRSTDKLEEAEHQREIDRRIEHFMLCGRNGVAVDMLLQLRQPWESVSRFDIKPSEYLPLLKTLLKQENPALHERLENCGLEWKKLTMCYLMALGLDDVEMMARASCLSPNSVKAYRTQVKAVLGEAMDKTDSNGQSRYGEIR